MVNPSALTSLGRVCPRVINAAPGRPGTCQLQGSSAAARSPVELQEGKAAWLSLPAGWASLPVAGALQSDGAALLGLPQVPPTLQGCRGLRSVARKEGLGRGDVPTLFYSEGRCQERLICLLCGLFSSCSGRSRQFLIFPGFFPDSLCCVEFILSEFCLIFSFPCLRATHGCLLPLRGLFLISCSIMVMPLPL